MARTHKLEYLGKNKRLVAPVVSAEARWSRTGGWQAAVRAVGKLVLAIIPHMWGICWRRWWAGF
jgi:hypothetical protein